MKYYKTASFSWKGESLPGDGNGMVTQMDKKLLQKTSSKNGVPLIPKNLEKCIKIDLTKKIRHNHNMLIKDHVKQNEIEQPYRQLFS